MTDSYYLINDQVKFYFEIENLSIEYNGQRQALEPKEARILRYVLENHVDGLIGSETILNDNWDYWSDKKVLQKVLSTLRKKFKNLGVTENGFVAADSNYKINYNAVLISHVEDKKRRNRETLDTALRSAKALLPVLLVVLLGQWLYHALNNHQTLSLGRMIQATAIEGASVQPSLSPDGRAIAFTHKLDGLSQIFLKVDASLNNRALTGGNYDQSPSWSPSGKLLAYQSLDNERCEIRLIRLDHNYEPLGGPETISRCNDIKGSTSIAWKNDNTLFFTDSDSADGFRKIKRLALDKGKIATYLSLNSARSDGAEDGTGYYFIAYDKAKDTLLGLQSLDLQVAQLDIISGDGNKQLVRRFDSIILSFGIYDGQVIFKDLDNQLKSFDIDDPEHLRTLYKNPLKTIANPVVSASANKIAVVSGSIFHDSIEALDLTGWKIQRLFDADALLHKPQVVDGELMFISEETGIRQIYGYSGKAKAQLTNFDNNKNIINYAMSNDRRWLAVSFADHTTVFRREGEGLTEAKRFPYCSAPTFSPNSQKLLLSNPSEDGNSRTLVEYFVKDFKETGITIRNARFGLYHPLGIVLVTTDNQLKLFKLDGIDIIASDLKIRSRSRVGLDGDSVIVSFDDNEEPLKINLRTFQREPIAAPIHGEIAVYNGHIYYKRRRPGNMAIFKGELMP